MASSKRSRHDENRPFRFVDQSTPVPKHPRLKAQPIVLAEVCNIQQERTKQHQAAADLKDRADSKSRVEQVLGGITDAGYKSLYDFVGELLHIRDQQISSRVSKMLGIHGEAILNNIRARQPDLIAQWAVGVTGEVLAEEGQRLADYLRPDDNQSTSELLQKFSLDRIMSESKQIAPNLCEMLRRVTTNTKPSANGV